MQRPSKFSPSRIFTYSFEKKQFYNELLNNRFMLSKVAAVIESYNFHYGIDKVKKKPVIITSIPVEKYQEEIGIRDKLHGICLPCIWREEKYIKGKNYFITAFQKKGVCLQEFFNQTFTLNLEIRVYILFLLIELIQKLQDNKLNIHKFQIKSTFLYYQKKSKRMKIYVCDMDTISLRNKKKSRSQKIHGNDKTVRRNKSQSLKETCSIQISERSDLKKALKFWKEIQQSEDYLLNSNDNQKKLIKIVGEVQKEYDKQIHSYQKSKNICLKYCSQMKSIQHEICTIIKQVKRKIINDIDIFCQQLQQNKDEDSLSQYQFDEQPLYTKIKDYMLNVNQISRQ